MVNKMNNKEQSRAVRECQFILSTIDMEDCADAIQTAKTDQLFAFWLDEFSDAQALAIGLASRD